jgi:hypothetical protein
VRDTASDWFVSATPFTRLYNQACMAAGGRRGFQ